MTCAWSRWIPLARPGFREDAKALDYYRRGLPEWYMWWGNNVFEYDRASLVQLLGGVHRALEQLGGVVSGVHPGIRILATEQNAVQQDAMRMLRVRLWAAAVLGALCCLFFVIWLIRRRARTAVDSN